MVLAAESRVTLTLQKPGTPEVIHNTFDNATKLFSFNKPHDHIGVVTYGQAAIGQRTAHSFIPEFEATLAGRLNSVLDYANSISDFFLQQWRNVMPDPYIGPDMTFIVGGFNNGEHHGRDYHIKKTKNPDPQEQNSTQID